MFMCVFYVYVIFLLISAFLCKFSFYIIKCIQYEWMRQYRQEGQKGKYIKIQGQKQNLRKTNIQHLELKNMKMHTYINQRSSCHVCECVCHKCS